MMDINVMMASGDVDLWTNAEDAIEDNGSLVIVYSLDDDTDPKAVKVLEVRHTNDDGSVWSEAFQVAAQYAPGMWMKVEFP